MKKWMYFTGWIILSLCLLMAGCSGDEKDEKPQTAAEELAAGGDGGSGKKDGAAVAEAADEAGGADGAGAADEAGGADGAGTDEGEQEEQILYGIYIQIGNQMIGHFQDVIDRYFQRVDHQERYTLLDEEKECLPVGDVFYAQMEAAIERVGLEAGGTKTAAKDGAGGLAERDGHTAAGGPTGSDALDEAYRKLYPVMQKLAEALDQMEAYTRKKANGEMEHEEEERLHGAIWKACREYEVRRVLFLEELDKVADAWEKEELGLLKEKGLEASYAIYATIGTARELREAIDAQGIDDRRIEELDIQALQPLYAQYVEEAKICLGYLEDRSALEKEGYLAEASSVDACKEQLLALNATLEELFQQAGEPRGAEGGSVSLPVARDGMIYRFEQDLSKLIDAHNALFEGQGT